MTSGSPGKLILTFAIPLMLGNIFQQFYTIADTMIVGRVIGVALILPKFIGENGIFYAEICAWSGAAVLLILSYGIIIQKHKNKTDVRYIPMKTAQGYIGQKKFLLY